MKKHEFYYDSADKKTKIRAIEWAPEGDVIGIVQVVHGVTEHILRYEKLAEFLCDKGFVVVGNDLIGHGKSISKKSKPMYFGPEGSWSWLEADLDKCRELTKKRHPNVPYCMIGSSLGSFLIRTFIINYPEKIDMAILVGTGQTPAFQISLGKFVANSEAKKYGEDVPTKKISELTFETYNKIFAPNRTRYDWLAASEKSVDEYVNDPLRGGDMSSGVFREMLSGMKYSGNINNIKKMKKDMPVLFLSGENDPVGDCGKGVKKACNILEKAGLKDVEMKLYPNLRHDILHEEEAENIFKDIYEWLIKRIGK